MTLYADRVCFQVANPAETITVRDARRLLWGPPQPSAEQQAWAEGLLLHNIR